MLRVVNICRGSFLEQVQEGSKVQPDTCSMSPWASTGFVEHMNQLAGWWAQGQKESPWGSRHCPRAGLVGPSGFRLGCLLPFGLPIWA